MLNTLILVASLVCTTPSVGTYWVSFTQLSGDCGSLPAYSQYLSFEGHNNCGRKTQMYKDKWPYKAYFDGMITWNSTANDIYGHGFVRISNSLTGNKCSGEYFVKLNLVNKD